MTRAGRNFQAVSGQRRGHGQSPLDEFRSQVGATALVSAGAAVYALSISAGKAFHLDSINIGPRRGLAASYVTQGFVRLSVTRSAVSTALLMEFTFPASAGRRQATTQTYNVAGIKGFVIVASTVTRFRLRVSSINTSMVVRLGGFLRDRTPLDTSS